MKIIGEKIFARDENGTLLSSIGTIFFRTPGLVTQCGTHIMQRKMWINDINEARVESGFPTLSPEEENAELEDSVDLIFTEDQVLIRPDPERMDLAFKADDALQEFVSKRKIRFLNTHSVKVRNALRARGENWRMSRVPISQDDMVSLIEASRVATTGEPLFYCNKATDTRYITAGGAEMLSSLPIADFRRQAKEAQQMLNRRNRFGYLELDLFPTTTPIDIKQKFKTLNVDALSDEELKEAVRKIDFEWRMSLPPELRNEGIDNYEWRNALCQTITQEPNNTSVEDRDLIQGISPEFYRQIEWLPGARVENGEVVFDSVWDEYARTQDPELANLCTPRVRGILFNLTRLFGDVEYVNIGRVVRSLMKKPIEGAHRGDVYIIQFKETKKTNVSVYMIRFQKWGIAEHLNEGKDLLQAILEANEYSDYILDRRLMCQQLGMNLPDRIGFGQFPESYSGDNKYNGTMIRSYYYIRRYIPGVASDKIQPEKFHNPAFALRFAEMMGEAAALDLIVGRASTETQENIFDRNCEVVSIGTDGLPSCVYFIDQAGSFVNYSNSFEDSIAPYANVVLKRAKNVRDFEAFALTYVYAFFRKLTEVQNKYHKNRKAFDNLLVHRPFDAAGSGAYRWAKVLERLDKCNPEKVSSALIKAIGIENKFGQE